MPTNDTAAATSGRHGGAVYGVVAMAGGRPVEVTVAFPTPAAADSWASQQRGWDAYTIAPLRFTSYRAPAPRR